MAWCWSIGKGKVAKVQKAGHTSPSIGIVSASQAEVVQEATSFMAACNGETKSSNELCASDGGERIKWQSEYCFRSKASVTTIRDESFRFNATKRTQFQAYFWRHADESSRPLLDQFEHGGMRGIPRTKY